MIIVCFQSFEFVFLCRWFLVFFRFNLGFLLQCRFSRPGLSRRLRVHRGPGFAGQAEDVPLDSAAKARVLDGAAWGSWVS